MDVPQHLVLGVVRAEHLVLEVGARARVRRRERGVGARGQLGDGRRALAEDREELAELLRRRRFVERDPDRVRPERAQVHPARARRLEELVRGARARSDAQRVEERSVRERIAELPQADAERGGHAVHALRDRAQAVGSVVDAVHPGHDREQHLRRADVARRLVAADVLLARLHRHPERGLTVRVDRHADDPTRHLPLVLVACREERGVRAAVSERYAEALRRPDRDVRAELPGRTEEREREQVAGDDDQRAGGVGALGERRVVEHLALARRVLEQRAEGPLEGGGLVVADHDVDADELCARAHDRDRLRVAALADEEHVALAPARDRPRHAHRLRGGGRLVEERGVGER